MYHLNVFRFFFSSKDHLYRIKSAEKINNIWKVVSLFVFASMIIYAWMAYLGIGSNLILKSSILYTPDTYESSKFWFMIGRTFFGAIYALLIIFIPACIFKLYTDISFQKLVAMQLIIFPIILIERLSWIPLVIYAGLDWYVSPFSFGIIASYFTSKYWIIYLSGAVSVFQIAIMWFQVKYIHSFLEAKRGMIWAGVITLHFVEWWIVTAVAFTSPYIIGGWFG